MLSQQWSQNPPAKFFKHVTMAKTMKIAQSNVVFLWYGNSWNIVSQCGIISYFCFCCSLTTSQVEKRLNKLNITDELTSREKEFPEYMNAQVRPHIEGSDMNKLMLYYRLIEPCPSLSTEIVTPETHRKLLVKLMPAAPGTISYLS